VLVGQCADLQDAAIPLLAIADALGSLAEQDERGRRAAAMEPPPELVAVGRGAAPGAGAFMPVLEVLRELSLTAPVVLAVEDVHWADRSTLDLLTFLVGRLRDERLLLVATYRSDEVDRRRALRDFLAEAARRPRVERLELARLTPAEALAQLEGILESSPARPFAEAIFARSEGNPLFYLWWCGRGADGVRDYEAAVRTMPSEPPSADLAFVLAASASRSCSWATARAPARCASGPSRWLARLAPAPRRCVPWRLSAATSPTWATRTRASPCCATHGCAPPGWGSPTCSGSPPSRSPTCCDGPGGSRRR
jgi:hypothetical protein